MLGKLQGLESSANLCPEVCFVPLTGILSQTPYCEWFLRKLGFGAPTRESLVCPTQARTPSQQHLLTHTRDLLLDPKG